MSIKDRFRNYIAELQSQICSALEECDGEARFLADAWQRPEGGGGVSKVLSNGRVFEKAGVNISAVEGILPPAMQEAFKVAAGEFFACGLSLVLHPVNPYVPTVHANWRYFELYNSDGEKIDSWFGGGSDLTPYYIFPEDGRHFHQTIKSAIDPFGTELYPKYKAHCDEYFTNKHRSGEARGIGGIFYDYLRPSSEEDAERLVDFQMAASQSFLPSYLPIVMKRKDLPYGEEQTKWQELRRGRYVEFNLIHDRGTLFGLKTNGRTESILMSLPPRARWEYNHQPAAGSPEMELLEYLKPRDWVGEPVR